MSSSLRTMIAATSAAVRILFSNENLVLGLVRVSAVSPTHLASGKVARAGRFWTLAPIGAVRNARKTVEVSVARLSRVWLYSSSISASISARVTGAIWQYLQNRDGYRFEENSRRAAAAREDLPSDETRFSCESDSLGFKVIFGFG